MANDLSIDDIVVGMKASASHTITDQKIKAFAEISGDFNPIHLDEEYAANTMFGRRIAHGIMVAGFISSLFAMKLPGAGCIYISQELRFKRPVYIDDVVIAKIEVIAIDKIKRRVMFETICEVNSEVVLSGNAQLFIPLA